MRGKWRDRGNISKKEKKLVKRGSRFDGGLARGPAWENFYGERVRFMNGPTWQDLKRRRNKNSRREGA